MNEKAIVLVYADESGDSGFSFDKGSSKYFVLSLIVFEDSIDAEEVDVLIKKYRRSLGWPPDREFKFHKTRAVIRAGFFKAAMKGTFSIRAVIVDKDKLADNPAFLNKYNFYNYVIKEALVHNSDLQRVKLRMDGKAENEYRRAVKAYLRQNLSCEDFLIEELTFVNSKNDSLIQLADMIAGAIRRTTETSKTDQNLYYKIIKKRIMELWHFDL